MISNITAANSLKIVRFRQKNSLVSA